MQNAYKTVTTFFSSSMVLHQLSYRTVKTKSKILQIEDILKFFKDFQHKYSKAQQSYFFFFKLNYIGLFLAVVPCSFDDRREKTSFWRRSHQHGGLVLVSNFYLGKKEEKQSYPLS